MTPLERLTEARDHLIRALKLLEAAGSELSEHERQAALILGADIQDTLRRLGSLSVFVRGGGE